MKDLINILTILYSQISNQKKKKRFWKMFWYKEDFYFKPYNLIKYKIKF